MDREFDEEVKLTPPVDHRPGADAYPAKLFDAPWTHFASLVGRTGDLVDLFHAELAAGVEARSKIDEPVQWFELPELRRGRGRFVDNSAWHLELALADLLRADRGEPHLVLRGFEG